MRYCPACEKVVLVDTWRDVVNGDLEEYKSCPHCNRVLNVRHIAHNAHRYDLREVGDGR